MTVIVQTQTQNCHQVLQEKRKKLKKKKPKSKKDIAIKKAKAAKAEGGEELDISKFHTITGSGRVSVPSDQWIKLIEFVQ